MDYEPHLVTICARDRACDTGGKWVEMPVDVDISVKLDGDEAIHALGSRCHSSRNGASGVRMGNSGWSVARRR